MKLREKLKPEDITVIIDTREQHPLSLAPMRMERGGLVTGDYTAKGYERKISIERKSLADLTQSLGRERERFDKELHRILAYPHRMLMIEGSLQEVMEHRYISRISPSAVISSLLGYASHGIPFLFCGNREQMSDFVKRFIFISVQRIWRENFTALQNHVLQSVADIATTPTTVLNSSDIEL